MYLSNLKLWNFRRFGSTTFDIDKPNLSVNFSESLNILIGENDSGKTAVIDAIRFLLKTHSSEWIKIDWDDFYIGSTRLRIQCRFDNFSDEEAKNFTEWLSWEGEGDKAKPFLVVFLDLSKTEDRILPSDVKAGIDGEGYILTAQAKEKIKTTYLRPLRDAKNELTPKRNSRLSQILSAHKAFQGKEQTHRFVSDYKQLNKRVESYFEGKDENDTDLKGDDLFGKDVKEVIDTYLSQFSGKSSKFETTDNTLKNILETLGLLFQDGINLGLGSHNLLSIASELLHLQKQNWDGLRLGLIEEIEAHLHPQVQLQVIETIQSKAKDVQLIFTTHSPNIGSKISLSRLIIFQNGEAFPMGKDHTKLSDGDYKYLERFLDVTKANLFFARGIILVEGWAEELVLPALANKLDVNLTEKGISIINIGNTAFLRFSKIFQRIKDPQMKIPVSVVTDVDIKPLEAKETKKIDKTDGTGKEEIEYTVLEISERIQKNTEVRESKYSGGFVKTFVSHFWTLEYCIAKSIKLRKCFYKSVLEALLEQKKDEGVAALEPYEMTITNLETYFNGWALSEEAIAFNIYNHILNGVTDISNIAKEPISKTIIGQRFAANLEQENFGDLRTEKSINYLIKAIEYAASNI